MGRHSERTLDRLFEQERLYLRQRLTFCRHVIVVVPDFNECNLASLLVIEVVPALLRRVVNANCLTLQVILVLKDVSRVNIDLF